MNRSPHSRYLGFAHKTDGNPRHLLSPHHHSQVCCISSWGTLCRDFLCEVSYDRYVRFGNHTAYICITCPLDEFSHVEAVSLAQQMTFRIPEENLR